MKRRSRPASRAYSLLRTSSKASPRWRMTWNLSNKIAACGACAFVASRNGFHMSMTARRMRDSSSRRARRRTGPCSPPSGPRRQTRSAGRAAVADHDPVGVTFADRDLVDADHLRPRRAGALELGLHVLLVQRLDRVPVQLQFRRHVLDRRRPAAPADIVGKALGVERIVRQKVEPLPLHLATTAALDPPHLQFQKYPRVAARQIAHAADLAVVPAHLDATATATSRFFERRLSVITRAFGSPKTPRTVGAGRKPGKHTYPRAADFASLFVPSTIGCQIEAQTETQNPKKCTGFSPLHTLIRPLIPEDPKEETARPSCLRRLLAGRCGRAWGRALVFFCGRITRRSVARGHRQQSRKRSY